MRWYVSLKLDGVEVGAVTVATMAEAERITSETLAMGRGWSVEIFDAETGNPAAEAASKVASDQPVPCKTCEGTGLVPAVLRTHLCRDCNATGIAE